MNVTLHILTHELRPLHDKRQPRGNGRLRTSNECTSNLQRNCNETATKLQRTHNHPASRLREIGLAMGFRKTETWPERFLPEKEVCRPGQLDS
jgi:hypothetical protein